MSRLTSRPDDSGNCRAMLAAMVWEFWRGDGVERHEVGRGRQHEGDGHRLAQRPAQAEHGAGDDGRAAVGQHGHLDDLPPGGAQRQRRLLVQSGRLEEHLAGHRGDDRQDHHRQHHGRGEHGATGGGGGAGEERDEPEVVLQPRVRPPGQQRRQHEDAPQAVDDARDRGQQVDDRAEGSGQAGRGVVADEQRHRDGREHGEHQGERRGVDRAEHQRQDVGAEADAALEVALVRADTAATRRRGTGRRRPARRG